MDYARAPLLRWERFSLWAMLTVIVAFGGLVEIRSVFLDRRMSDLTVFLRAGWAVRAGEDIYQVSDEDIHWYYVYPPVFAILMAPLGEAPTGYDRSGCLPYSITVAIWYFLNIGVLCWCVNKLATALQDTSADPQVRGQPRYCRRWWMMRTVPIFACLVPIGSSLSHGQTNLLLLAMLCGMLAAILRKKPFEAGLWMAGPICMKVFPAFLLIYPLWRRDFRCLGGCALGLVIGLIALPVAVFGPERTLSYYQEFADLVLLPGVGQGGNTARADTLTSITATDTQSFMAVIHNTLHLDPKTRPDDPAPAVRLAHWGLGAVFTLIVCLSAGWRPSGSALAEMLFLGLLVMLMMFLSPVCHLQYFVWLLPTIMGMLLLNWENRRNLALGLGWMTLIGLNNLAHALAHLTQYPHFKLYRDLGLATYVGLAFGVLALIYLRKFSDASQKHRLNLPHLFEGALMGAQSKTSGV
jgi:alpha-1,2-mannosyltransferase